MDGPTYTLSLRGGAITSKTPCAMLIDIVKLPSKEIETGDLGSERSQRGNGSV